MTEPTGHRAEAEGWLSHAKQVLPGDAAIEFTLLAIAHDLHRIADALEPKSVPPPPPDPWAVTDNGVAT